MFTVDDTIYATFDFGHLGMVRIENGRWIDTSLFEAFNSISDRWQSSQPRQHEAPASNNSYDSDQ
jgi:hypothetical protein